MITRLHKPKQLKGFTLIELTVVIVIGLMIATMTITLFNQQLVSFQILRSQNFMIQEAPKINSLLSTIVSKASSLNVDEENDQLNLTYSNPGDNTTSFATITYLDGDLTYSNDQSTWNISTRVEDVAFSINNGVLRIKLTGPDGGEINYSTTPQQ